jgi:hypothetical protein
MLVISNVLLRLDGIPITSLNLNDIDLNTRKHLICQLLLDVHKAHRSNVTLYELFENGLELSMILYCEEEDCLKLCYSTWKRPELWGRKEPITTIIAPEVLMSAEPDPKKVDLWILGCIIYYL